MKYSPKGNNIRAVCFCMLAIACTALFVITSVQQPFAPWISQLGMIISAVVALQIYTKYILSNYTYYFDDCNLVIDKTFGRKIVPLASLDLSMSISEVMTKKQYEEMKDSIPNIQMHLNYCKTLFAQNPYVYVFDFNGKVSMLTFEPSENFVRLLNEKIQLCTMNKTNPNNEKDEEE